MSDYPPGYRFYPTEEELVSFYLGNKLENMRQDMERVIPVVGLYSYDPVQLPGEILHLLFDQMRSFRYILLKIKLN